MAKGLGRRLVGAALAGAGAGILQQAQQRRQDTLLRIRRQWQQEDRAQARDWALEDRQASEALTREGWDRADARSAANQPLIPTIDPETGSSIYTPAREAAGKQVPTTKKADRRDPLIEVKAPDGRTVLVPESQAAGLSPPDKSKKGERLYVLSEDPMTGERTYGTAADALAAGQAGQAEGPSDEEVMDRAAAARKNLGPSWTETDYWNPAVGSEEWLGVGDEEFDQRLAQMIRQNPNVPDDELARQLAAQLTEGQQGGEGDGQAQGGAMAADQGEPRPPAGYPPNARQAPDGKWYVPDPNSPSGWSLFTP